MTTATNTLSFDVAFSSKWWSFVSSTRVFVSSFCGHSVGDAEFSDKVAMTTHELLENAVKYSASQGQPILCQVGIDDDHMWVRVKNEANPDHIQNLHETYREVTEGDPLDVYVDRMQRSVTSEKSELGLARIRYEGEAQLRLTVDGGLVTMEATFTLPEKQAAHE